MTMMKMRFLNTMHSTATITRIVKMKMQKNLYKMACLKMIPQTTYLISSKRAKDIIVTEMFRKGLFLTIKKKLKVLRN